MIADASSTFEQTTMGKLDGAEGAMATSPSGVSSRPAIFRDVRLGSVFG
jgi:hypothetical protein